MARILTAAVHREHDLYVSRALEVEVASQGQTIEQSLANLREALELFFDDQQEQVELAHPFVTSLEIGGAAGTQRCRNSAVSRSCRR